MDPWIAQEAGTISAGVQDDLAALVGVSSPSGDVAGAEAAVSVTRGLLPGRVVVRRLVCSSPGHAPDLLARLPGRGTGRIVLLGHLDTVVPHDRHAPLTREDGRLRGSGAIDMKGGIALALGVLRALGKRPEAFAEVALLLVADEEWRTAPFTHVARFADWDGCLCFEAGERGPEGSEGVVVRRKAAATLRVEAHGAAAHSGSAPDRGRNALLALAEAARVVAAHHDPGGSARLTAVPTVMRAGESFNVVPAHGELFCDLRADDLSAIEPVVAALPGEVGEARLQAALVRRWPGMDTRESTRDVLAAASARLGREVCGTGRGGASDASHFATALPIVVDGLGPRGGGAHAPDEHVLAASLGERAEVALAVVAALLGLE